MAQQDVRYYLNGMLLEADGKVLRTVATDGHRLAYCEAELEAPAGSTQQVIVPRKGVLELQRLLGGDGRCELAIGTNHVRAQIGDIRFTSKLIDGRFPGIRARDSGQPAASRIAADRDVLRAALQRAAILSNEKYRGIRLAVKPVRCCCSRTIQSRKRPRKSSRSATRARKWRSDSTSITCWMPWPRLMAARWSSDLTDANNSCLLSFRLDVRRRSTSSCRCGSRGKPGETCSQRSRSRISAASRQRKLEFRSAVDRHHR